MTYATRQQHAKISQDIENIIEKNQAKKIGAPVSATYAVEVGADGPIMDCEILVPLDKKFDVPSGFVFKDRFLLTNAVMITHVGNPTKIQGTVDELNRYIEEKKLRPITTGYNVSRIEAKSPADIDNMEIDIYVGISPNIL